MKEVEAVKNRDTIKLISYLLERHFGQQMADVWNIGLNLALRISDLLAIKFSDIQGDRLSIIEQKTGKPANIKLNDKTKALIEAIHERHPEHVYLFQSYRCSQAKDWHAPAKPLTRRAVARAFAYVGEDIKLALGTHSMRKTRGYLLYQQTKDIARVIKMLRHSCEAITLRYIGIEQEQIDNDFVELEI